MSLLSLAEFAGRLERAVVAMDVAETVVLTHAAKKVQKGAKAAIGHYQEAAGPFSKWEDLAESTIADKENKGFAPPDNPLRRTGDMAESIEYTVRAPEACVGSDSDIAVYQELGTHGPNAGADGWHIPPRSFLGSTAFRMKDEIGKAIGFGVTQALISGDVHVPVSGE